MPVVKLVLEYEGTEFAGWQIQPDVRTVQGELNRALSTLLRREIRVQGAGRTDAGVHALGQVASFPGDEDVAGQLHALNAILPGDVVVRSASRQPDDFHARHSAVARHYRYRLHRGPTALERRTCLPLFRWPDVEALREAAARLPGHRDFASFGTAAVPGESTECDLTRVAIVANGDVLDVEVSANRFLRKMVRTLVGTLLEIGWGKQPPEWLDGVLTARDRTVAGPVVAPQGLCLVAVTYPETPANLSGGC